MNPICLICFSLALLLISKGIGTGFGIHSKRINGGNVNEQENMITTIR